MLVRGLTPTNVRAFEHVEMSFKPGFNLIAGVNGVGKSTILYALARSLEPAIKSMLSLRMPVAHLSEADVRFFAVAASIQCRFSHGGQDYEFLVHRSRAEAAARHTQAGMPRDDALVTPERSEFLGAMPPEASTQREKPLAVLYSVSRTGAGGPGEKKRARGTARNAAWLGALDDRGLDLQQMAHWLRALKSQELELPSRSRLLESTALALRRFLVGYDNLRVSDTDPPDLLFDAGKAATLTEDELTDAEGGSYRAALDWATAKMALEWAPPPGLGEAELNAAVANEERRLLQEAVSVLMPGFTLVDRDGDRWVLNRPAPTLSAQQLSEGERGILALILDLTRRLAQANPRAGDPAKNASAVVLIDELELHLHPAWQRQIIARLTDTFPECQFIATTHSPQIVGELPHDRIQIITGDRVFSPTHSFGVDSSRVLEEIMDASPRSHEVAALLDKLSKTIADKRLEEATSLVAELSAKLGEDDPEVIRARTLLDFLGVQE